ncbi:MAG: signal recognition particle protein [Mycoplasmoidaceae bacterium]
MIKKIVSTIISNNIKRKLENSTIKEENIRDVLYEIRISLLDADVNLLVVKKIINSIKNAAIGRIVSPDEKIDDVLLLLIKEQLLLLLDKNNNDINWSKKNLKIMLVGLQGSGKTTTSAKIANLLKNKYSKKPMLVALDIYRPAAIEQLNTLAKQTKVSFFQNGSQEPSKTAKESLMFLNNKNNDSLIFDTAGRLQTNENLMIELQNIKKNTTPDEILLVIDGMSGQDALNVAKEFHEKLNLTGIIVTKLDSDSRAGSILSISGYLDVPIKLIGMGEKINQLDVFHPSRIADRILGLGDIMTLAEKAADVIDEKDTKKFLQKMLSGKMDLNDLMKQMEQFHKIGSMNDIAKMIPMGMNISNEKIFQSEEKMKIWKVIISSMTLYERKNPNIVKRSPTRKNRIIKGSGRKPDEINKLISEWEKSRKKMEELGKMMKKGHNPFSNFMKNSI